MRVLAFLIGMTAVTGACADEFDVATHDAGAVTARVVFESRFGGEAGLPAARSFQLLVASEAQRAEDIAPLRAEYRFGPAPGRFLLNGIDLEQSFASHQLEEEGGLSALWGGWFPLAIVLGAAALIIVDGNDQDFFSGTGVSGGS